jgi:hypothetical protein
MASQNESKILRANPILYNFLHLEETTLHPLERWRIWILQLQHLFLTWINTHKGIVWPHTWSEKLQAKIQSPSSIVPRYIIGRLTKTNPKYALTRKFLNKIAGRHEFLTSSLNFSLSLLKSPNFSLSARISHYFPRSSHYVLKLSLSLGRAVAHPCRPAPLTSAGPIMPCLAGRHALGRSLLPCRRERSIIVRISREMVRNSREIVRNLNVKWDFGG